MKTVELIVEDEQNYFMREAFNTLRTNILFCGKDIKTILLTSCFAHEGKSTVSFELARRLNDAGKKVLLIDADLRKSVMATTHSKQRNVNGLSQLLSGQIDAENAIYHTQFEGLDIVFAGPFPPNPTELVGGRSFQELIREMRSVYDYVLVDAPPLGLVIDAAVMAGVCDGAVLVINNGKVKFRVAQHVKMQLEKSGCKILGVVLNQVERQRGITGGSQYKSYYAQYGTATMASDRENVPVARKPAPTPAKTAKPTATAPRPTATQRPAVRPTAPVPPASRTGASRPETKTISGSHPSSFNEKK